MCSGRVLLPHGRCELHNLQSFTNDTMLVYEESMHGDDVLVIVLYGEYMENVIPVVPPPGGVSAEITPGNLRERKSTPYL